MDKKEMPLLNNEDCEKSRAGKKKTTLLKLENKQKVGRGKKM